MKRNERQEAEDAPKAIDLKAISRKSHPTGQELGILEIERLCEIHKAHQEGREPRNVIPDIDRFMAKLDALDPREEARYNRYIELHHWIMENYNDALFNMAAAERNVTDLELRLREKTIAEETLQFLTPTRPDMRHRVLASMPAVCRDSVPMDELFDDNGDWSEHGLRVENDIAITREWIAARLYAVKGYNYALERIGELLDVPDVVTFKVPAGNIAARVGEYNIAAGELKRVVKKAYAPDRARKVEAAARIAKPITARKVGELSAKDKAQIDELIKSWRGIFGQPPLCSVYRKKIKTKPLQAGTTGESEGGGEE